MKYHGDLVPQKYTNIDSHFTVFLKTAWATFKETDGKLDSHKFDVIHRTVLEGWVSYGFPWIEVDFLYFLCHIHPLSHWFMVVLDINRRTLMLYDSMKGKASHDNEVKKKLLSPWYNLSITY